MKKHKKLPILKDTNNVRYQIVCIGHSDMDMEYPDRVITLLHFMIKNFTFRFFEIRIDHGLGGFNLVICSVKYWRALFGIYYDSDFFYISLFYRSFYIRNFYREQKDGLIRNNYKIK